MQYLLPAGIFVLDRLIKLWAQRRLAGVPGGVDLWPGLIRLYYVRNSGMAFGMLPGQRWLLIVLSLAALAGAIAILRPYKLGLWARLSLLAILGGMVGNLADRALLGYVVDMIDFPFIRFAVINVADIFITLGAVFLCLSLMFRPRDWLKKGDRESKA